MAAVLTPPARRAATADDVTVLIPVRNRAERLRRALASVAAQTLTPAGVLVVDDASDDADVGRVARAAGARVLRLEHQHGAARARNAGLLEVATPWVAFLDSDDEWLPGHLEALVAHADGRVLVGAPAWRLPAGRIVGHAGRRPLVLTPARLLVPSNPVTTSAVMVRRDAALAAGGFSSRTHAEDLELWVNLLEHGGGVVLPGPTALYHEHEGQASADRSTMRAHTREVLVGFRDRPWWTRGLLSGFELVLAWDDLRAALRARRPGAALGAAGGVVRRVGQWPTLAGLLADRWRSRRPGAEVGR
jgi:glycosyltransferase involved in cell wall biosynthesis